MNQNLIKNELASEETVLVHGTSVEAVIGLLKTGKFNFREIKSPYEGYLFFKPNGIFFEDNTLGVDPDFCAWEYANEQASGYAWVIAQEHYALNRLGFVPEECGTEYLMSELASKGCTYETYKELTQRKGVLLGLGKNIFDLNIESGKDDPSEEVCIYLPEGLDEKYINGIKPLGELERKMLEEHLNPVH